ncbi:MAG: radical SAM protein [Deltaproteobacteria bacterium]
MIIERALTIYLKWKYARILQLTEFEDLAPPTPVPGREYLVYIHIPFCEELCPYCSFNRVPLQEDLARDYFKALNEEIRIYADLGFQFRSVYVGGGTPTVLPDEIARLLGILRDTFPVKEISLETNPNHLTDEIVPLLKDGGVNRLSVGVQSFDDSLLQRMDRYHKYGSGREIRERLEKYLGVFDTLNVDMIFNFPGQTLKMIDSDLDVIRELEADQATFYPLMVSDATRKELAERFGPISYRQEQVLYTRIAERLEGEYDAATAWCFSRRKSMIDEYIVDYDEFSERERIQYDFMMKLFGTTLDVAEAEKKHGGKFLRSLRKEIAFFRSIGALVSENGVLRLTRKGRYMWVIMMREFFTGVNNFRDICRVRVDSATRIDT